MYSQNITNQIEKLASTLYVHSDYHKKVNMAVGHSVAWDKFEIILLSEEIKKLGFVFQEMHGSN